jgi:hypothetical protein
MSMQNKTLNLHERIENLENQLEALIKTLSKTNSDKVKAKQKTLKVKQDWSSV